jgi:hypothetical protein
MKQSLKKSVLVFLGLLLLMNAGCKDIDLGLEHPEEFDISKIITLKTIPESIGKIRADGITEVTYQAGINPDSSEKVITFSATSGTFIGAQNTNSIAVPINHTGFAEATLRVGTRVVDVEVTASVLSFRAILVLELERACADNLSGESSTSWVKTDGSIMAVIKALLSRDDGRGTVSVGTPVTFQATQVNDQNIEVPVGRFLNGNSAITDEKEIATNTFAADTGNVAVGKPVKIKIKTQKDDDSYIEQELYLNVFQ